MPQVLTFVRTNDPPKFRIHRNIISKNSGLSKFKNDMSVHATDKIIIPNNPSHLMPCLSNQRPVKGCIIPITIAGGIIARPETVGEYPKTS